ncbi:related to Tripeptidyl-peptidase sed1 [Rhynchosporium agropyri]|uniref:Related to Tripeptidyl-peptidase sed1 n=1 Tax=Rhynchosporium agropyri TaxID=914238 RepID=A0A1E1LF81_9HELO|nr:related to Tripeptidyl-peptidase sed1 [Rhynchosporium agropyri]
MLMRSLFAILASGLVIETVASPVTNPFGTKREIPASHGLHERHLAHWSEEWVKKSKIPGSQVFPMRIGLKQHNLEAGHNKLMELSTPGSASYGNHMTPEEVIDFFAPPQSVTDAVLDWLHSSGIGADRCAPSVNKQWIQFDATAEEVENLLFADFYLWKHSSGVHDISTEEYHLPKHIQEHVDYITPGIRLRQRSAKVGAGDELLKRSDSTLSGGGIRPRNVGDLPGFPQTNATNCDVYVTADCTRVQYDIPAASKSAPGNKLGIYENNGIHYSRADLDVFYSHLYPHIPNGTYPEERLIDGAFGAIETVDKFVAINDSEAALDFGTASPLIYPQGLVLFQDGDEYWEVEADSYGFWNNFLDAIDGSYCTYSAFNETGNCKTEECLDPIYPDPSPGGYKGELQCGVYKPTNVISISYEANEFALPDNYIKRQCNEWMKLALQGVTTIFPSGDSGVGRSGGRSQCKGASGNIFKPIYASSCPYALSVGGTQYDRFSNSTAPIAGQKLHEVATTSYASGGGFSNVFGTPSYQRDAVDRYFDQVKDKLGFDGYDHFIEKGNFSSVEHGVFHRGGRAYPDVSAVGDRQIIYSNGTWIAGGGTSVSAPVWGAILTLVNEERIAVGKSTVGFVNPVLYQHPEAFNDITVGSNPGCGGPGFLTAKGWDPVTGLGSPNFPVLLKVLMSI